MTGKKKNNSPSARKASKYLRSNNNNKRRLFPHERLILQAYLEAKKRANIDPTPINFLIAELVLATWRKSLMDRGKE